MSGGGGMSRAVNFIHIPKNAGTSMVDVCANSNGILIYHGHGADVRNIPNQLIVIRNPVERFISAFRYAKLIFEVEVFTDDDEEDDTPENWIRVWRDPEHPRHAALMHEMMNDPDGEEPHKIGDTILEYKWTYTPQSDWIDPTKVKYVVLYDCFEFEMKHILNDLGVDDNIPHANGAGDEHYELSHESIEFLRFRYADDFRYYERMKRTRTDVIDNHYPLLLHPFV